MALYFLNREGPQETAIYYVLRAKKKETRNTIQIITLNWIAKQAILNENRIDYVELSIVNERMEVPMYTRRLVLLSHSLARRSDSRTSVSYIPVRPQHNIFPFLL